MSALRAPGSAAVQTLWAELVAATLADAGVRLCVISPGSRSTPLVTALAREARLELVTIIDERAAAFYALGAARATDHAVALVCTSGSAAAHYLPAIVEAHHANIPLVALTADRPPELQACGASQTIDQRDLYGRFVRAALDLGAPHASEPAFRAARRTIVHAVTLARGGHPGPVHVNVPLRKPLEPAAPSTDLECELARIVAELTEREPAPALPPTRAASTADSHARDSSRDAATRNASTDDPASTRDESTDDSSASDTTTLVARSEPLPISSGPSSGRDTATRDAPIRDAPIRDASIRDASTGDASARDSTMTLVGWPEPLPISSGPSSGRDTAIRDAAIRDASTGDASARDSTMTVVGWPEPLPISSGPSSGRDTAIRDASIRDAGEASARAPTTTLGWSEPLPISSGASAGRAPGRGRDASRRPVVAAPRLVADAGAIDELARIIASEPNGVIVAGALPALFAAARDDVFALAVRAGYPIIAEAGSQLRFGPRERAVVCVDHFDLVPAAELPRPRLIIQLGAEPVATAWPAWLAASRAERFVLAGPAWHDPEGTARVIVGDVVDAIGRVVDALERLPASDPRAPSRAWAEIEERAAAAAHSAIAQHARSETALVRAAVDAVPAGGIVQVGNSLPIRVIDHACAGGGAPRVVLAQRGAAGIDGLIASAAGATRAGRPVLLVLGDVSFAHDLGGLLAARDAAAAPLAILVVDNRGGQIFAGLPIARAELGSAFAEHWLTAPGVDPAAVATALGIRAVTVAASAAAHEAISRALAKPGVTVVHAPVSMSGAHDVRRTAIELWAATGGEPHVLEMKSS